MTKQRGNLPHRDLHDQIEDAFLRLIDQPWGRIEAPAWHPAIDIHETRDAYIITADLPGLKADEIDLQVGRFQVTVCGIRVSTRQLETIREVRVERVSGRFCRTFHLDHAVTPQGAQVRFEEGVYEVRVPKETPQPGSNQGTT